MYTANLRQETEYIFRQSVMGSVGHIASYPDDYLQRLIDGNHNELRIDTWCGRNYKFNDVYSSMTKRSGVVRNACEYCFMEYDPDERPERRDTREAKRRTAKTYNDNLPF